MERATLHGMAEKHKLHNVRLDDEVWAAVKAMDCSLNQYLRLALLDAGSEPLDPQRAKSTVPLPVGYTDPATIPGVQVGAASIQQGFPCRCVHTSCRGAFFQGRTRSENMCTDCREGGHSGLPRNCEECFNDQGPA